MKGDSHTFVAVKICGITRLEDALFAARCGADFLGYVFHARSARNVDPAQVRSITDEVRLRFPSVRHVGVMVDPTSERAVELVGTAGLDFAQLHGMEPAETVNRLRAAGVGVIKALRFGPASPPVQWQEYEPDYFLCDTYDPHNAGGTGHGFDLALLPHDLPANRTFLAGGLTSANVPQALEKLTPYAVDVSSGVEQAPGVKSCEAVEAFVKAVRGE